MILMYFYTFFVKRKYILLKVREFAAVDKGYMEPRALRVKNDEKYDLESLRYCGTL